tara:strand:+ start:41 stop:643 length:603 start_codon:yes stop_codon:yes gene_type:complete
VLYYIKQYKQFKKEIILEIDYEWAMPNSNTFSIKPIHNFIQQELNKYKTKFVFSSTIGLWIDPFARDSKIATITNDINPNTTAEKHLDALEFLKSFKDNEVDGVLFDPPYSLRQVKECYDSAGLMFTKRMSQSFFSDLKNEISRIVQIGGKVLSFGWSTNGMGKNRGFKKNKILIVPHGGQHYDTLCVSETKINKQLQLG